MKDSNRLIFLNNKQSEFINLVKRNSNLTWEDLAECCRCSVTRLQNELRHEKYSISYKTFKILCSIGKVEEKQFLKYVKEIKNENWGRVKGGMIGGSKPKEFSIIHIYKPEIGDDLAEFIGIVIGDGSISKTNYDFRIILNKKYDKYYVEYVKNLIVRLFRIEPSIYNSKNTTIIRINSKELFWYLVSIGLSIGKNEKVIPNIVLENEEYSKACLRGLFDTDGSVYLSSRWCVLNFKSSDKKVRNKIKNILEEIGIPCFVSGIAINLTSLWKIEIFFKEVGSSNHKNIMKFISYIKYRKTLRSNEELFKNFKNYANIQLPFKGP